MTDMGYSPASPRHGSRPAGWHALKWLIITVTALLAPLFFIVMFLTVNRLLQSSFGPWAPVVPIATEGCFAVAYLLGILLEWAGKPMTWLRFIPWLFAAASLVLNVWASLGDVPGMLGHAVVTVAFFLPLIAGEAAVRSLSRSEEDLKLAAEMADARRYALDLVRDRKGIAWRFRVPSLLRVQILHRRPPAAAVEAIREGAMFGGPARWESAVEAWIADGLTRRDKMAVTVDRQWRTIAASASASEVPSGMPSAAPQGTRQPPRRQAVSGRLKAQRILTDNPEMPLGEVAKKAGISKSTVERVKRDMPTPLRPRAAGRA